MIDIIKQAAISISSMVGILMIFAMWALAPTFFFWLVLFVLTTHPVP